MDERADCTRLRLIRRVLDVAILSGTYRCAYAGYQLLLTVANWILRTVWEVLALCLALWITVKYFRELPTGWTIENLFSVLMKTHVLYFAS
jgi:hypothetical protein